MGIKDAETFLKEMGFEVRKNPYGSVLFENAQIDVRATKFIGEQKVKIRFTVECEGRGEIVKLEPLAGE